MINDGTHLSTALSLALDGMMIDGLQRLSGGASRETWRFTADGQPLIAQCQRNGDERDMSVEVAVLSAAWRQDVPVAELLASGSFADGGGFFITEFVPGETVPRRILRDDEYRSARSRLAGQLGEAAARIHQIDVATIDGLDDDDQLDHYQSVLDDLGEPHPAFELAIRWLLSNRPESTRRTLVHGDLRLGNLIVDDGGLRAVLDWELAHIGNPMEDLGWACVKAWRFGSDEPAAGVGSYDELFGGYERVTGCAVDAEVVHWWEVLGTLKWGIMCISQANVHRSGTARSHELAAIGRRVCENEYDLMQLLDDRWSVQ